MIKCRKDTRSERVKLGLCRDCPNKLNNKNVLCFACMEKNKERKRKFISSYRFRDCGKQIDSKFTSFNICRVRRKPHRQKYSQTAEAKQRKRSWSKGDKCRSWTKKYVARRRSTDIQFKLSMLRNRFNQAIKGNCKSGSAVSDLGCTMLEFIVYFESLFTEGMSWENNGIGKNKWQIDHIIPLALFDLTDRKQLLRACHYTNLQPLWSVDNTSKGKKLK